MYEIPYGCLIWSMKLNLQTLIHRSIDLRIMIWRLCESTAIITMIFMRISFANYKLNWKL